MILELLLFILYALTVGIVLMTYLFYPFIAKLTFKENEKNNPTKDCGALYVIIPAYNEESVIDEKIKNSLKYLGPKDEIVVVSDASDDSTNSICTIIAEEDEKVRFYVNHERGGKNTCLNLAVEKINANKNDILIFTDCNTFFDENSLLEIKKSLQAGSSLVAGSMVYQSMESESAVSEGLYWRYEEWIRRNESENGRLIVCNGGLFGMWANCYETLPPFVPNDFEGPLRLCGEGEHVMINPEAKGIEPAINSPKEEYSRKKRMANRQMNCILYLWKDLNIGTKNQVLFHKLFRWFGMHLFLLSTVFILFIRLLTMSLMIDLLLIAHFTIIGVIILALINQYLNVEKKLLPKILHAVKVHVYGAKGALKAIFGTKTSIWEKAKTNR